MLFIGEQKIARNVTSHRTRERQEEERKMDQKLQEMEKERKSLQKECVRHKFDASSDKKRLRTVIRSQVAAGVEGYERNLQKRRQRLKLLLECDDQAYTREITETAQRAEEGLNEEMRRRAEEMRAQREAQRKAVVEEKRLQQYRDKCPDLREIIMKRNLHEVVEGMKYQMAEKEARRKEQKEEEKMWEEILKKNADYMATREEQEKRERFQKQVEISQMMLTQKLAKEAQDREYKAYMELQAKQLEEDREKIRQEELRALENKQIRREEEAETLRQQVALREGYLKRQAETERSADKQIIDLANEEMKKEASDTHSKKAQMKKEISIYLETLEKMRQEREEEEKRVEEVMKELRNIQLRKQEEIKEREKEARKKLLNEVIRGRQQQLEDKKQAEVEEMGRLAEEREHMERQCEEYARMTEAYKRRMVTARKRYGQDLLNQAEYNKKLREDAMKELDRQWMAGLMEEEDYIKRVKETLMNPPRGQPNPFRVLLLDDNQPS